MEGKEEREEAENVDEKCGKIEGTWGGKRRGISLEGGRTRI